VLGDRLVGVYVIESLALGGYEPGRSDVYLAVVVEAPLARETKEAVVAACRHEGRDVVVAAAHEASFRRDERTGTVPVRWTERQNLSAAATCERRDC
jgi:hypothetical protein